MDYQDKTVKCVEAVCGHAEFVITAGEQSFFASKGYPLPKRCKPCREAKKLQKTEQVTATENRKHSPFTPILDQMKQSGQYDGGERRGKKKKDGWKHNRRNGREAIGFEGRE